MSVSVFLKKHKKDIVRVACALALCVVAALFIYAFSEGKLPYSADGDAFDTIYGLEEIR